MERADIIPGQWLPVHPVVVNSLTIEIIHPDRTVVWGEPWTLTPTDPSGLAYKWDAVVYHQKTSLVFYIGFSMTSVDFAEPSKYVFTYTLNVTFEDESFDLAQTFTIKKR